MKGIGNILLMVFFALAIIGLFWVVLTPGAASSETDVSAWMNNAVTTYMVIVPLILLGITVLVFAFYKILDLVKHPSHMREAIYVFGAIVVAGLIGLVAGSSDPVAYGSGEVFAGGFQSRMISAGLIAAGVLLIVGLAFLIWDTVRGFIKS
ncbi:MAG: hypothetical protein Q4F57_06430 [Weeksellaceae bacterium]|nr:hypothetical protein [Weeksellaceae bacterium]